MTWEQVRELCPHSWVVVEALKAYTHNGKRIVEKLSIIGTFDDNWKSAWDCYKGLREEDAWREYLMLHTDRVELEINVVNHFGRPVEKE